MGSSMNIWVARLLWRDPLIGRFHTRTTGGSPPKGHPHIRNQSRSEARSFAEVGRACSSVHGTKEHFRGLKTGFACGKPTRLKLEKKARMKAYVPVNPQIIGGGIVAGNMRLCRENFPLEGLNHELLALIQL